MKDKFFYLGLISIVVIISFYFHSPIFSPLYHSDNAIHVLMAYSLDLPHDLYYWGQDRLGSLIPIVSHVFIYLSGIESIYVVSVVQYLFILIIYFTFSSLFTNTLSKISLALILFLPLSSFLELIQVGHPYTPSLVLIGISVFILNSIRFSILKTTYKNTILFFLCGLTTFLSLWASEISIVFIVPIALYVLYVDFFQQRELVITSNKKEFSITGHFKVQISKSAIYLLVVFITGGIASLRFIFYAKAHATKQLEYESQLLNSTHEVGEICSKYFFNFLDAVIFRANDTFLSLAVVSLIVLIIVFKYLVRGAEKNSTKLSSWFYVFLLAGVLHFALVISAHWVYVNNMLPRYSSSLYFIFWVALLLFVDRFKYGNAKLLYGLVLLISIFVGLSSFVRFVYPVHKIGTYQTYNNIKSLAPAGLMGSYWTAYMLASMHPSEFYGAPGEGGGFMRNGALLDSLSYCNTIYLIKNGWIDSFPEVTKQFGFWLKKKGTSFTIGDFELAPYVSTRTRVNKSIPDKLIYPANSLSTMCQATELTYDSVGRAIYSIQDLSVNECYLTIGPYLTMAKGKYQIHYEVKVDEAKTDGFIMTLDVYSEGKYFAALNLTKSDFEPNKFQQFTINLELQESIENAETRVRYLGKGKIWVRGIVIEHIQ